MAEVLLFAVSFRIELTRILSISCSGIFAGYLYHDVPIPSLPVLVPACVQTSSSDDSGSLHGPSLLVCKVTSPFILSSGIGAMAKNTLKDLTTFAFGAG